MSFSSVFSQLRKNAEMSQTDLAQKLDVKQYIISNWESGRSEPCLNQLIQIADYFSVPVDFLLDRPSFTVDETKMQPAPKENLIEASKTLLTLNENLNECTEEEQSRLLGVVKSAYKLLDK